MPGIFGIISTRSGGEERAASVLDRFEAMAAAMRYEPGYSDICLRSSSLGVVAGWSGRAEEADDRLLAGGDGGRVRLLYSGEPYVDESPTVNRQGARALQAYLSSGEKFLDNVLGQFSGLLYDENRGRAILFVDRLGMERLFVHQGEDAILFSNEAKAILAAAPETRAFDADGLAQMFAFGCTLGVTSLFSNIRLLPGGSYVQVDRDGRLSERTYFDRSGWEKTVDVFQESTFLDRVGSRLDDAVRKRTTAPPSVAVSLTGGLDSRMILAAMNGDAGGVSSYTFGSMYRDTHDVKASRAVAGLGGQPHKVIVLGSEFVGAMASFVERSVFISDAHIGFSGAAELYLNGLAAKIAPVRVTGNYGGELLRGFRAFAPSIPRGDFLSVDVTRKIDQTIRANAAMDAMHPLSFTLFHQAPSGYGRYAIERSQLTVRSPFLDDRLIEVLYGAPRRLFRGAALSQNLIARRRPELLTVPTDRGYLGRGGEVIRSVRRICRELSFKGEYLIGHGAPDVLASLTTRFSARPLESLLVGRHKFQHPRIWSRGPFGDYLRETVLSAADRALGAHIDAIAVRRIIDDHLRGRRNYWHELETLLTLSLGSRLLLGPAGIGTSLGE